MANDPLGHVKGAYHLYFNKFVDDNQNTEGEQRFAFIPSIGWNSAVENETFFNPDDGIPEQTNSYQSALTRVGNFITESIDPHALAAFAMGAIGSYAQSNTPVVDEAITVKVGRHYQLGLAENNGLGVRNVGSVVVQDDTDTTTYVDGTDYKLDAVTGRLQILEGGGIADDDVLHIDYTPATETRTQVLSADDVWEGSLRMVSNNAVGKKCDAFFPRVKLTPNGDYNMRPDTGPQQIPFSFEILKLNDSTEAVYLDFRA